MPSRRREERPGNRRTFLKVGAIPLMGFSLPKLLASESTDVGNGGTRFAKNIILVWLGGGPSTIDMWDLKPDA
ncbi:MAG: DUF1501 domain-containing protein, partial [Planctomycetota bacterium]